MFVIIVLFVIVVAACLLLCVDDGKTVQHGDTSIDVKSDLKIIHKIQHIEDENIIRFTQSDGQIIGDYVVGSHVPSKLHLGKILTKDNSKYTSGGYFPLKDIPELKIHNLTGMYLSFNGHIVVPPRQSVTYKGREQNGMFFGFKLYNDEQIFELYEITQPTTDIYFGVILDE